MASLELKIMPFIVPVEAQIILPGNSAPADTVSVPLSELDEATLENMIEEFAAAVMVAAGKA